MYALICVRSWFSTTVFLVTVTDAFLQQLSQIYSHLTPPLSSLPTFLPEVPTLSLPPSCSSMFLRTPSLPHLSSVLKPFQQLPAIAATRYPPFYCSHSSSYRPYLYLSPLSLFLIYRTRYNIPDLP
jgi:hypothetical protein